MRFARIGALLFALPALALAQQKVVQHRVVGELPSSLKFELPEGAKEVSIPFRNINNHLILNVKVNGEGPFPIILDTGMPVEDLMLYGSERVEALRLHYLDGVQVKIAGAGGNGGGTPARMAAGITLGIGDLKILDARAMVLPTPAGFGTYHDGVIGAALFRHFAVSIDNDRSLLTLRRPETYRPPVDSAVVPLTLDGGMPFIEARVQMGPKNPVPVHLVVDLGASHAISLNEGKDGRIVAPEHSLATALGRGVGGEITGRVGRIRSLEIGGLVLKDVIATFPDEAHRSPGGMHSRDGNLGNEALRHFNVTFDFAGNRMVLEPSRLFSEPFEWNMSGMQAEPAADGTVLVRRVLPDSPAAQAGVRVKDRILRIAGEAVTSESYYKLTDRLRKAGETVALELGRGEKTIQVSIKLRRQI